VLVSEDFKIIDNFVASCVEELLNTKDFTSVSKTRTSILLRSKSETESAAAQYAEQYCESAFRHISQGIEKAQLLTDEKCKSRVIVNLLIVADGLEDFRAAKTAGEMIQDKNKVIQYWAVHCFTNDGIVRRINIGGEIGEKQGIRIAEELSNIVQNANDATMGLMVNFAQQTQVAKAEDLLLDIADERIRRYQNWSVKYELLDADILKAIEQQMEGVNDPVKARRFGQLLSYVMQRYIKGQEYLSAVQKGQLCSVMVEVEKNCISRIFEMPQANIQKAVEQGDIAGLMLEHKRLFGDEEEAGQLASKLNFDYGKGPDGREYISPLVLPEPPANL
jgi:hypothetical protein